MPIVAKRFQHPNKKPGIVVPIRVPLNDSQKEIEVPIRLMLTISFHQIKHISEDILTTESGELMPNLTRRQNQVLRGILGNKGDKQIADELNLSVRTIKFHVSSLLIAFRVRGRGELRTAIFGKVSI